MVYLIQVTVYSALLYTVYLLALKNRASHNWNRAYLLLCAVLPPVIPLIELPATLINPVANAAITNILLPEINVYTKYTAAPNAPAGLDNVLKAIYALGMILLLLRCIVPYIAFLRFTRQHQYRMIGGAKVLLNTHAGPGSFGNYVFFREDTIDTAIFDHELAHIQLKHSSDILFLNLLKAFFWPNIILYMIGSELKIVHEFQADTYAVKNKEAYITTLLNETFGTNQFLLSHTFFYHPLKRRIMMLQKSPLSRKNLRTTILKTGFSAALLIAGVVYLQSCKHPEQSDTANSNTSDPGNYNKETTVGSNGETTRKIFKKVDSMPRADYDLAKFLSQNLKYPEKARENKTEGRVLVKFVVNENGKISDATVVNNADTVLAAEALRAVSTLPPWKPGMQDGAKVAVYFTLPIVFKLE